MRAVVAALVVTVLSASVAGCNDEIPRPRSAGSAVQVTSSPVAPPPSATVATPPPGTAATDTSSLPRPSGTTSSAPTSSAPTSSAPTSSTPTSSASTGGTNVSSVRKKGVGGVWSANATRELADSKVGWYYNWSAKSGQVAPPGVEFVPMIWFGRDAVPATLDRAKSEGAGTLLGFNEPDLPDQADMSVEEALDLWPRLESTGLRLGSPAVSRNGDVPGKWLDRFMAGATSRGLRVDFVAVHWYSRDFSDGAVQKLRNYLQAVHDRYGRNVWLTEFALYDFVGSPSAPPDARQAAFAREAAAMMEELPFVERYAWFSLENGSGMSTGLYRGDATPTPVGTAYRTAGSTS